MVPILRAGVGMLDGVLAMIPVARVGFLGMYRDEETLQPVVYYSKLPGELSEREILLLDPMLATGGSAADAVRLCKEQGARSVRLLSIIAAPEGIAALHAAHPDVEIYCAAIDRQLNEWATSCRASATPATASGARGRPHAGRLASPGAGCTLLVPCPTSSRSGSPRRRRSTRS